MQDEKNYEEFEYSFADFEEDTHRARKIFIAIIIGVAVLVALFFGLTAQGSTLFKNISAGFKKSFADITGSHFSHTDSEEVLPAREASDTAEGAVLNEATTTDDGFPLALPVTVKKVSPKKSVKKSSSSSKTSAKSASVLVSALDDPFADDDFDLSAPVVKPVVSSKNTVKQIISGQTSGVVKPVASSVVALLSSHAIYPLTVSVSGGGRGFVSSTPDGIACDGTGTCEWNFPASQKITLRASHDTASSFGGWGGACSGTVATCTISVMGAIHVSATFSAKISPGGVSQAPAPPVASTSNSSGASIIITPPPPEPPPSPPSTPVVTPTSSPNSAGSLNHVVIAVIQTGGAVSTNDFIVLHNPTGQTVDMSGWKLRKKSSTGTDSSIRTFSGGTTIAAGADFIWGNSAGGFSDSIHADIASTQTIAADNSIALMDGAGVIIDAVAWGGGVDQYVEGAPYPDNPSSEQSLVRRAGSDGSLVDTNDNAKDFSFK